MDQDLCKWIFPSNYDYLTIPYYRIWSEYYTLNVWSWGKQLVLFSQETQCLLRQSRGKHPDWREHKTNCLPRQQTLSALLYIQRGNILNKWTDKLGQFQTSLYSCAEPNWWIKYDAFKSVWYDSFRLGTANDARYGNICRIMRHWSGCWFKRHSCHALNLQ